MPEDEGEQKKKRHKWQVSKHNDSVKYPWAIRVSASPVGQSLREWWHQILRNYGRYDCYAILLALPADEEATRYLIDFGKELQLISKDNCLVIALSRIGFIGHELPDATWWSTAIDDHIREGYCLQIAELFNIRFDEFPCLLIFQDVRSTNHFLVTLKGLTGEEIAQSLRSVFAIIQEAISDNTSPLTTLENQRNNAMLINKGENIVSELRNFTGKTFETVIETWIKTIIK